jgi:hypothetical protein
LRVVGRSQLWIHQHAVCFGELRRARRCHLLELGSEVLHLVGVVARDLLSKGLLDVVGRR